MPGPDYATDLALLSEAAVAAGELALRYWKRAPNAWEKDGGAGPVSEADLAVNDLLAEILRDARPDYGWLSEESQDDPARLAAKRLFVVDPIDGTRAFLANEPGFAHAIAVVENGKAVAGVVHLPVLEQSYTATLDGPAQLDGKTIQATETEEIDGSTLLTVRAVDEPFHWNGPCPAYKRSFRPSLAWRLCLVAEGRFDASLSLRQAWEWDVAAASLIAERAGAVTSDRIGTPLSFNTPSARADGLLVANPILHAHYLAALRR
ncbi:myo-inositol-1(or 4)-monophosphatase [Rhodobacter aestuarii]|uniref:Myo-inositol-1(Or 4)-monophosphatase n=1 Tax=Rhodobacter aestuarii TaxID=453582 RepID=A0A1N7LG55_9RHOB|nr:MULTISPECIES: 3'(2'),5'-bisphosphate nucleotidase CysQ [Rhodobacter]PTV95270.1 myo-inositol-1(or 4)-monophosphatase [Rhodobacter aestuarii]SIS72783.1 myo-inositol-1(or 4)-monophosphatase [Rhodobacter aestuarii]SOC08093.1 myo-inositol-1(or 4)-monophosphatase [Rhodobacter sp. JA431]